MKIIEYIMEKVARARGVVIPQGADRQNFVDDVLRGANLRISIKSEMEPCASCRDVISDFNLYNTTPINISGGTKFYKQNGE